MRGERPFIQEAERTENKAEDTPAPVTLVLVDDNGHTRRGLRILLDCDPGVELIGEARVGDEVFSFMTRLQTDTVIIDARVRNSDWANVRNPLDTLAPGTKILVFTSRNGDDSANSPAIFGLTNSMMEPSQSSEDGRRVYDLTTGRIVPPSGLSSEVSEIQRENSSPTNDQRVDQTLTSREAEVFQHIARGLRDREIANALGISSRTVETHVRNLLRKLGATNRLQALLYAVRNGWL